MAFTTLSPWVIGQQLKAITINLMTTAIQELQAAATAVGMLPNAMEQSTSTTQSIPNAAFTVCTMPASSVYTNGSGLTATANGITVAVSGRYLCTVNVAFAANVTGRRVVGIAAAASAGPAQQFYSQQNAPASSAVGGSADITREVSFTAGDTIAMWVYQDSGVALAAMVRSLSVRQVG